MQSLQARPQMNTSAQIGISIEPLSQIEQQIPAKAAQVYNILSNLCKVATIKTGGLRVDVLFGCLWWFQKTSWDLKKMFMFIIS